MTFLREFSLVNGLILMKKSFIRNYLKLEVFVYLFKKLTILNDVSLFFY